jgi:hypothetical protein
MRSSIDRRPFFATVWFGLLATAIAIAAIFLASVTMPSLEGRPTSGFGQVGVMLVAIYWVFVFPKLRKIQRGERKAGSALDQAGDR